MHTLNRCKNVKYNLTHEIRTWVLAWKMAQSVQALAIQAWWCQSPRTHIKSQLQGLVSWCMPLIPSLSRQRQADLFKDILVYIPNSTLPKATEYPFQVCDPSTDSKWEWRQKNHPDVHLSSTASEEQEGLCLNKANGDLKRCAMPWAFPWFLLNE